jgi:hypothetical protein
MEYYLSKTSTSGVLLQPSSPPRRMASSSKVNKLNIQGFQPKADQPPAEGSILVKLHIVQQPAKAHPLLEEILLRRDFNLVGFFSKVKFGLIGFRIIVPHN